jgi:hypothetical protein
MKCPLDENDAFEQLITVYGVGNNLSYCIDCIKKKLFICNLCGFFIIKGDKIKQDPFIEEYHSNKKHNFIEVNDDILEKLLKSNNHGFFNYKKPSKIIIEI